MITTQKSKRQLWNSLVGYKFENLAPTHLVHRVAERFGGTDASTRAFASKLCRKFGWTEDFALRAISEYKKFVYLGVVGEGNVTPSKVIDQVWHEHMLFTKAYRDFCADVLNTEFDHFPELIPVVEQTEVFNRQYHYTVDFYKAEFGKNPPTDIWGLPKFDQRTVSRQSVSSVRSRDNSSSAYADEPALYQMLYMDSGPTGGNHSSFDGFGGGKSGGAGVSAAFEVAHSSVVDSSSVSSGGGDSGGSSGCSSGGGCSSGCGGGCGS